MIILSPMQELTKDQIISELNIFLAKSNNELTENEKARSIDDLNLLLITARYFPVNFFVMSKHMSFRFTILKKKEVIKKPSIYQIRSAIKRATAPRNVPNSLKKYYL